MTINSTTEDLNPEITTRFSDILRRGYPFAVAAVLAAINTRAGFILLESLAGTQAVGVFAAATRITDGLRTLPNALFGALLPALAGLSTTPDAMRHLFWRIMAGLGAFGVICGTFLTVLGGTILALVFGGSFAYDGLVLAISGWALLAALLRGGMTLYLYALGHETRVNQVALLILFPYIALNLWLIPGQGAIGAALALLIAEASGFILLVVWRR